VRTASRAAALFAAATTLTFGALAAAPVGAIPGPDRAAAFGPDLWLLGQRYFPLPTAPSYGDGLGAGRGHEGQDLFAPAGTPELAIANAVVLEATGGYNGGRGNYVSIYDPAADRTYNYFHMLDAPLVAPGERVHAGARLGRLGCSGSCWGDHLHFEVRRGRDPYGPVLDPLPLLRQLESER
jgi:murein DD-endopeptidase MepM/ murein hydrolase activator NlpD